MATATAARWTTLGPGSVTVALDGTAPGTPVEFSCEVLNAAVTHDYDEGDSKTMLCGTKRGGGGTRADGFKADIENDLSAAGLTKFLYDNDMKQATVTFTPNTTDGAKWVVAGITLLLPDEIGADEFGAPIASSVEWTNGTATFTPSTAASTAPPVK